ncbi:MAG: sodium-independent anion transporter, partial [Propionibacteriaceae bacterium]
RQPGPEGLWVDAARHPDQAAPDPGLSVVRVEGGIFFANVDYVRSGVHGLVTDDTHAVVLDAETTPFIDVSGASMLVQLQHELAARGTLFYLAQDLGQVRDVVVSADPTQGSAGVYPTVDQAVAAASRHISESTSTTGSGAGTAEDAPR